MYRIEIINKVTGERKRTAITFASKKKAEEWARQFKEATPNSEVNIKSGAIGGRG